MPHHLGFYLKFYVHKMNVPQQFFYQLCPVVITMEADHYNTATVDRLRRGRGTEGGEVKRKG